jgi:hypothetical protein
MRSLIVVRATFDEEAGVWWTESPDLPGLRIEGASFEELQAKLPDAILDLLECSNEVDGSEFVDVPVELIASASSRLRVRAYA